MEFNRCKSHIKYMECASLGVPLFASDALPYNRVMSDRQLFKTGDELKEKLALVGLGYVGMPIAIEFAKRGVDVIGFDLNKAKIELYKSGVDPTNEVGDETIKNTFKPVFFLEANFLFL